MFWPYLHSVHPKHQHTRRQKPPWKPQLQSSITKTAWKLEFYYASSRLLRNTRRIQKKTKRSAAGSLLSLLICISFSLPTTVLRFSPAGSRSKRTSDKTTPGPKRKPHSILTSWCDGKDMEGKNQSKRLRFQRAFRYGGPAGRPARPLRRSRRPVGYWCCYVMSCQPLGDAPAEPFPVSSLLLLLLILSVADGGK